MLLQLFRPGLINRPISNKIPEVRFSAVNVSPHDQAGGIYSINITHTGGDNLNPGEYSFFINDNSAPVVPGNIYPDPETNPWTVGETITVNSPVAPEYIRVYYYNTTKVSNPALIGQRTIADITTTPNPTITITPTPVPCTPVASFIYFPPNPDTNSLIIFTDTSTCIPTSWNWTSSDGWSSTPKNPAHSFSTAGTYTITLTVSNMYGTSAPYSQLITVTSGGGGGAPVAGFTANTTSGCTPLRVQFTDTSTGSPTSWSWSFGDGGTSVSRTPSTPTSLRVCTVSLTATNGDGSNTKTQLNYITVSQAPVANFTATPTTGCQPLTVQFTDSSTVYPPLELDFWRWNKIHSTESGEDVRNGRNLHRFSHCWKFVRKQQSIYLDKLYHGWPPCRKLYCNPDHRM